MKKGYQTWLTILTHKIKFIYQSTWKISKYYTNIVCMNSCMSPPSLQDQLHVKWLLDLIKILQNILDIEKYCLNIAILPSNCPKVVIRCLRDFKKFTEGFWKLSVCEYVCMYVCDQAGLWAAQAAKNVGWFFSCYGLVLLVQSSFN